MPDTQDETLRKRRELHEFLQARRAALKPEQVGLQATGRRRAPGLRREEVASLACVGLTWYTWLEQGRNIHVSEEMLQRIARALRLSPNDTIYLFSLAGRRPPEIATSEEKIEPSVQLALDGFTAGPAWVLNRRVDVIAFNRLADAVYRITAGKGPFAKNMVWRLFMDPERRRLYGDWNQFATFGVGFLRGNYASRIGNADFESLIRNLRQSSAEFERLWSDSRRTGTSSLAPAEISLRVPGFGILNFISVRLTIPNSPDQLMVLVPPADKKCEAAMARLSAKIQRQSRRS